MPATGDTEKEKTLRDADAGAKGADEVDDGDNGVDLVAGSADAADGHQRLVTAENGLVSEQDQVQAAITPTAAGTAAETTTATAATPATSKSKAEEEEEEEKEKEEEKKKEEEKNTKRAAASDPLRWFGIFVPPQLKAAQRDFSAAVAGVIPRLAQAQAEMRRLEHEIGRAREQLG